MFVALVFVAGVLLLLVYRSGKATSRSAKYGARFAALFLMGSVLVGALYFLVVAAVSPRPGLANLLWVLGVPLVVGLFVRPRAMGLALSLPLGVTGWLWLLTVALTFRIPLE